MTVLVIIVAVIGVIIWMNAAAKAERRRRLVAKYGDAAVVERIMRRHVWQGMTAEQLVDSRGRPADVDEKVHKAKVVRIYKYDQESAKRFRTRITVEDDEVIGWTVR